MYKIRRKKFCFIAHPRTGSRSVREAIMDIQGAEKVVGHHAVDIATIKKSEIRCCTTRNIWDLLVSWYYNTYFDHFGEWFEGVKDRKNFQQWLEMTLEETKVRWLNNEIYHYGLLDCNHVLKYERLQDDWNDLMDLLKYPRTKLEWIGKSVGRQAYRKYYTPELRDAVAKRWARDIALTKAEF
jgi:hypothetical protein